GRVEVPDDLSFPAHSVSQTRLLAMRPPIIPIAYPLYLARCLPLAFACAERLTLRHRIHRSSNPLHRHHCKGRESYRDSDRRLSVCARRARRQEGPGRGCRWFWNCRACRECPVLALGYLNVEQPRVATTTVRSFECEGQQCRHTPAAGEGTGSSRACTSPSHT